MGRRTTRTPTQKLTCISVENNFIHIILPIAIQFAILRPKWFLGLDEREQTKKFIGQLWHNGGG